MATNSAIEFENVWKHYSGGPSYRGLRHDLRALAGRLAGAKPPPKRVVKALEEVSFEIPEGQSCALLGDNGSGKTTSLKLATRISYPSRGRLAVRGRVGALIEVGTGLHPELTGRENLQLYGRILGMPGREIQRRYDTIIEFAGVQEAIDQPVKQYSTGMQLRLGFAVAAYLEPDILVVDEAIAVGDSGFQYRCIERMGELVREGRTLVFVSHDMAAVEALCQRAILLRHGRIWQDGPAREVVRAYLLAVQAERRAASSGRSIAGEGLEITRVSLHDQGGNEVVEAESGVPLTVRLQYRAERAVAKPVFRIGVSDGRIGCFTAASMFVDGATPGIGGEGQLNCTFEDLPLEPRMYEIWGSVRAGHEEVIAWQRLLLFRVGGEISEDAKRVAALSSDSTPVKIPYRWNIELQDPN